MKPDAAAEARCRKPRTVPPNINVTPMIDVLLVLLIIFMVIAPTKPAKFETKIPAKPTDTVPHPPSDLLMVTLSSGTGLDQTVELNSHAMPLPELAGVLKKVLADRPDRTVFIKAPRDKQYQDVVAVIDSIKEAGAAPIGLQVDYLH